METTKVIRTASGTVSLRQYVEAWRAVRAAPAGREYRGSLTGWWCVRREELTAQFQAGLHDRINQRGGLQFTGRNHSREQFWRFWRDSRAIRRHFTERTRVHRFETRAASIRFSQILASGEE